MNYKFIQESIEQQKQEADIKSAEEEETLKPEA